MPPNLVAHALLASIVAVTLGGVPLWRSSPPALRRLLLVAFLCELPMCALMAEVVRAPIDAYVKAVIDPDSNLYLLVRTFYAPLTEEPGKLLPLLLLAPLRRALDRSTAVRFACALGLGFAIGEAWYVARALAASEPRVATVGLLELSGFSFERTLACVAHAAFTATALVLATGPRPRRALGFLAAAGLHFLSNSPIPLARAGLLPPVVVPVIALVTVAALAVLLLVLGLGLDGLRARLRVSTSRRARCPTCREVYARPVLGLNLPDRRFERCAACGRWQWIGLADVDPDDPV